MLTLTELLNYNLSDYDHEETAHCSVHVILEALMVSIHWQLEINEDYLDENYDPDDYQEYAFEESICFDNINDLQTFVHDLLLSLYQDCYNLYVPESPPIENVKGILADFQKMAARNNTPFRIIGNRYKNKTTADEIEKAYGTQLPPEFKDFLTSRRWELYEQYQALDLPGGSTGGYHLGNERPVKLQILDESLIANRSLFLKEGLCPIGKFLGQGLGIKYFGVVQVDGVGTVYITEKNDKHRIARTYNEFMKILETPARIIPLW